MKAFSIITAAVLATQPFALMAQAPAAADQRLREQLKLITAQLRTAETERTALQADKAALEKKAEELDKDKKKLMEDVIEEQKKAKTEGERLQGEITVAKAENEQSKNLLVKADAFGKQSAELARKTEAERARLAGENIQLKRVVADQRMKNGKMFEIGSEILTRYQNFGLGTAISAREPFIGITRARLEALAEDYSARLAGQRIRLDGTSPKPAAPPTTQAPKNEQDPAPKKHAAKP